MAPTSLARMRLVHGWLAHALAIVLLGFYQQGFRNVLDTIFNTPLMWLVHALQSNAMSDALPLFESLGLNDASSLALPLPGARHLALRHHRLQHVRSSTP